MVALSRAASGKAQALGFSPKLGWSHYRALMNIENAPERLFYEIEAEQSGWAVAHLGRARAPARQPHQTLDKLLCPRACGFVGGIGITEVATTGQEACGGARQGIDNSAVRETRWPT